MTLSNENKPTRTTTRDVTFDFDGMDVNAHHTALWLNNTRMIAFVLMYLSRGGGQIYIQIIIFAFSFFLFYVIFFVTIAC